MQRHRAGEFLDARQRLGQIHGQHLEWLAVERVAQAVDRRHLRAARLAPRRPEIHQHYLAAVVGEPMHLPRHVLQLERGRRTAAPRLELRAARQHRDGKQEYREPALH